MIGVAQNERSINILKMLGGEGFDCCLRAHRGKDRGEQGAMRCGKRARSGASVFGADLEFKHRMDYTLPVFLISQQIQAIEDWIPGNHPS